ncbi:MAG: HPF/RaiA family ribosome-associated protein [Bdellovibrionales bacterium]|nr:HPF/RaiA family ribosome-associated protein [Bdellovibrionales bacterium]
MSSLNINGFELDGELKSLIKQRMLKLEKHSPSTSHQFVNLSKLAEGMYQGSIKVSSVDQKFFSEGSSEDIHQLIEQLSQDLDLQLSNWKQNRKLFE